MPPVRKFGEEPYGSSRKKLCTHSWSKINYLSKHGTKEYFNFSRYISIYVKML